MRIKSRRDALLVAIGKVVTYRVADLTGSARVRVLLTRDSDLSPISATIRYQTPSGYREVCIR